MLGILLAGGLATRLYPLTANMPKALLPIGGKPLIEHILGKLSYLNDIEKIIISTNNRFEPHFSEWLQGFKGYQKDILLHVEELQSGNQKLGAIRALNELQKKFPSTDYLIIGADNLFNSDLKEFIGNYKKIKIPLIAIYQRLSDLDAVNYSSVVLDGDNKIIGFNEKQACSDANLIGTCIYAIPRDSMQRIQHYLNEGNNPDSLGYYIEWLCKKEVINGYILPGQWWDIGTQESYKSAKMVYESNK